MVSEHIHEFEERKATAEAPYRFTGSGLPHVYLIGVKYRVCKKCQQQMADIPAVRKLMQAIARTVVESDAALTGDEIRFLRKRLGKKSSEFAQLIGVTLEEVSRWENGHVTPGRSADKLIRVFYSMTSGDRRLKERMNRDIEEWLGGGAEDDQAPTIRARLRNQEWTTEAVPA